MLKAKRLLCLALVMVFSVGTAAAATVPNTTTKTFVLGDTTVGSLTIQEFIAGNITNTKWELTAAFAGTATTPKIEHLLFDYTGSTTLKNSWTFVNGDSTIKGVSNTSVQFETGTGNGKNPFTAGESVTWIFSNTNLSQFDVTGLKLSSSTLPANAVSPVPEPSTYGMMLAGGLVVAFAIRRRRSDARQSAGVRPLVLDFA